MPLRTKGVLILEFGPHGNGKVLSKSKRYVLRGVV